MATVSEVKWYKTKDGQCPYCNRNRPLGRVNVVGDPDLDRCIDCCFGPPMEFWMRCSKCGELKAGDICDSPLCVARRQLKNIEASLKRLLTQVENSSIENATKCPLVADLEEMLDEIHHLAPVEVG